MGVADCGSCQGNSPFTLSGEVDHAHRLTPAPGLVHEHSEHWESPLTLPGLPARDAGGEGRTRGYLEAESRRSPIGERPGIVNFNVEACKVWSLGNGLCRWYYLPDEEIAVSVGQS
jgi:hypothetical protein